MPPSAVHGQLTGRSETLDERLARLAATPPETPAPLSAEALRQCLAPWARAFARGRFDALCRRLAWDGRRPEEAALAFRRCEALPPSPPAPWTRELTRYAELARAMAEEDTPNLETEIPFVELWLPWVRSAGARLDEERPAGLAHLSPAARADLEFHLLAEIARLSELAAYDLFDRRRGRDDGSEDPYREFVAECLEDPLGRLYGSFPVLARQSAETVRQWRETLTELVRRLDADQQALAETFAAGRPLGRVRSVRAGLSDRHGGGRQVMLLDFESGLALVYKPRGIELERALERWLTGCAELGFELCPRAPRALARGGYGWVEAVRQERLTSRGEAARYYRRAGALVAFAYALRAADLHSENVVATRDGPVIVDAEMFLQPPRVRARSHSEAASPGSDAGSDSGDNGSCLESGLLLHPGRGDRGRRREWGGLRPELQRRAGSGRRWRQVNTGRMTFEPEEVRGELGDNVLRVGSSITSLEDHHDEIAEGFESAYRFLMDRRDALLDEGGLLDVFRGAEVRVLLRPSQEYGTVLTLMSVPRNQRSGLATSLLYEAMLSPFSDSDRRPRLWPLVAEERAALVARDVPRFTLAAHDTVLRSAAGESVPELFSASGWQAVRDRIATLDEADLARQLALIRRALEPPERLGCLRRAPRPMAELEPRELDKHCRALARDLADELLAWSPGERLPAEAWPIRRGRIGIALFYAALAHEGGGSKLARAARKLVRPIEQDLDRETRETPLETRLGGFSGLGSLVYASTWLFRLTGEPGFLDLARRAVRRIDAGLIRQDRAFDLEWGTAGALLGLLAFYETAGEAQALELARACGDHLLEHQEVLGSAGASWRNTDGLAPAGWAHGAAGIARALAALGETAGGQRYRVAAVAALGYERTLYDRQRSNWPVLTRVPGAESPVHSWSNAWCHGAPGIALSRLLLPARFHDDVTRAEIAAALRTAATAPPNPLDHLCCGTLGRGAVLLTASRRTGSPEALGAARRLTAAVIDRASADGGFLFRNDPLRDRGLEPGFLLGLSGVGYHLLRISGAAELPDVLALELPSETGARLETSP